MHRKSVHKSEPSIEEKLPPNLPLSPPYSSPGESLRLTGTEGEAESRPHRAWVTSPPQAPRSALIPLS